MRRFPAFLFAVVALTLGSAVFAQSPAYFPAPTPPAVNPQVAFNDAAPATPAKVQPPYGGPVAPPKSPPYGVPPVYGNPQTPNYGVPQAPPKSPPQYGTPQTSYGVSQPQCPPCTNYGAPQTVDYGSPPSCPPCQPNYGAVTPPGQQVTQANGLGGAEINTKRKVVFKRNTGLGNLGASGKIAVNNKRRVVFKNNQF